ncbi:hypothetical protein PAHAL_6G209100 [Panicum hallii]|uniref:Uncharacterized protein n=1 Tax=Panicum hallii TaxID=206008 RepID=A0A2T8IH30_9POAL|nr:hypothetical protein PAHAL_6G209100 [Panicum hallii]
MWPRRRQIRGDQWIEIQALMMENTACNGEPNRRVARSTSRIQEAKRFLARPVLLVMQLRRSHGHSPASE